MNSRIKYWILATCLGILPLMALAFLTRPSAAAGPWYVAPDGSDANNCQTPGTPCGTINGAIGKASPGDTINVATGTYTASIGEEVVWITRSVTLLGGWDSGFAAQAGLSTIDGGALRRGMTVQASITTSVDRFGIQNATGGILNYGNLTLSRSLVTHNRSVFGAGIRNTNAGILIVNDSTISNNTSDSSGGGVGNESVATINDSLITGNTATEAKGGGVDNSCYGTLTINRTTVSGNQAIGGAQNNPSGGGIASSCFGGTVFINNSTVSGNSAVFQGGGISNYGDAVSINSSTITDNSTAGQGGGVSNNSSNGSVDMTTRNSIIAGNEAAGCVDVATVASAGYNLIGGNDCGFIAASGDIVGTDPRLSPLEDSPGYRRLLAGSPAINAGNPGGCMGSSGLLTTDQRGYPRVGRCDIGAIEVQPLDFSDKFAPSTSPTPWATSSTPSPAPTSCALTQPIPPSPPKS